MANRLAVFPVCAFKSRGWHCGEGWEWWVRETERRDIEDIWDLVEVVDAVRSAKAEIRLNNQRVDSEGRLAALASKHINLRERN